MPAVPQAVPPEGKKKAYTLEDYAEFVAGLAEAGIETVVIGGCAVGAYAHLRGETVLSGDLDLYTTAETLYRILDWSPSREVRIVKRPQPRALQVAVLDWLGKEVIILAQAGDLPPPDEALRLAREFILTKHGNLSVLVADPFDLLQDKLKVNRPKDREHQEVLRRFVEEEVVAAFKEEADPRARVAPARRFLEVTGASRLPEELAARILPLARTPADLRFLMHHASTAAMEEALLEKAPADPALLEELKAIRKRRAG